MNDPVPAGPVHAADPAARRLVLIIVIAIIAAGIAGHFALQDWLAGLKLADPERARAELGNALVVGVWVMALLVTALAAYIWHQGAQVRRISRFPLPDAKLLRATPIVEGSRAQSRGLLLQVLAGALLLIAVGLVSAVHALIGRLDSLG